MTFISCHRIWLWEVLEITVCKNNCEVCDVFLWSLRCCFFFIFCSSLCLNFLWQAARNFMLICTDVPFSCSTYESAMHTRTHTARQSHSHTHTSHTHSFYYANFHVAAIRLPWRKLLVFVTLGTRHWWDREGWCEKEWDHATPRDNTRVPLPPLPPFPVLFLLGTPRLEFILIFSSSWQRFYLHCFNLYLFCTLKITLRKGCGGGEGGVFGVGGLVAAFRVLPNKSCYANAACNVDVDNENAPR